MTDAEIFVLLFAEFRVSVRRRDERDLRQMHHLTDEECFEFMHDLVEFHSAFMSWHLEGAEGLNFDGLINFLVERGCISQSQDGRLLIESIVSLLSWHAPYDFHTVLKIVCRTRQRTVLDIQEVVWHTFVKTDKDGSGELDMQEVSNCLVQLDLLPSSPKQQIAIARIMEEVDVDGSGDFVYDELLHMIQRIKEKVTMMDRAEEVKYGMSLGFTKHDTNRLRFVFSQLDVDGSGTLDFPEVKRALVVLRGTDNIADAMLNDIREDLVRRGLMPLHYLGFMELTKRIDEEFQEAEKRALEAAIAKRKKKAEEAEKRLEELQKAQETRFDDPEADEQADDGDGPTFGKHVTMPRQEEKEKGHSPKKNKADLRRRTIRTPH